VIDVSHLSKTFRVAQKEPGLAGAIKGLFTRHYRDVHAVRDISFSIKEGELVGFLGPNGAGKNDHAQNAFRTLAPDRRRCDRPRTRAVEA